MLLHLSSDWDPLLDRRRTDTISESTSHLILSIIISLINACLPIQKAALFDWASAWESCITISVDDIAISCPTLVGVAKTGRREMGDVFGERVLGTNAAGVDGAGFACLGQCVVA